jgi:hypothetical protein
MARTYDSGWRDAALAQWHAGNEIDMPAPGMWFPMVEYDRGEPLALISYFRLDQPLPSGPDAASAHRAMSDLHDINSPLPLVTVRYDPRNWSFCLFVHNEAAADWLLQPQNTCVGMSEAEFVKNLYWLRGRPMPVARLESLGAMFSTSPWNSLASAENLGQLDWPGQDLSARRRMHEPAGQDLPFSMRNPCTDIDLAVVGLGSSQLRLLVDYKLAGRSRIKPNHATHHAMSKLRTGPDGSLIPYVIVRYEQGPAEEGGWLFSVHPMNETADTLLGGFLGRDPDFWSELSQEQWLKLLASLRAS